MSVLRNKFVGCMLGAAIGDAIGKQSEGLSIERILETGFKNYYGKAPEGSPGEHLKPGDYTDDTEQMLVLAESLIAFRGFDVNDFSKRLAQWGIEAMNDPVKRSLVGPASADAIRRLKAGVSWKDSGSDFPSCGSAMRAAPIGLFYEDPKEVESNAVLSSIPTHNSNSAMAGAVAVAVAAGYALLNMECIYIIEETCSRASKYDAGLASKIKQAFDRRKNEPEEVFYELGTSYFVYDTVPSAFFCFSKHFDEPEKAILTAVNAGGDTDSIGCITGALCGALLGASSLPEVWKTGLENRDLIEVTAERLYETRKKKIL